MENLIEKYIKLFNERGDLKAVSDETSTFTYIELYKYACYV